MRTHGSDPMRGRARWMVAALIAASLGLAGCDGTASSTTGSGKVSPAKVEAIPGQAVKKVMLTEQAAKRIGVVTVAVAAAPASLLPRGSTPGPSTTTVPYSAVVYDPNGKTWVYTVPEPLTYVREEVVVVTVGGPQGTDAVLSAGPPVGTTVVKTAVIELYGAELGIGK